MKTNPANSIESACLFLLAKHSDRPKHFYETMGVSKELDDEVPIVRIGATSFILRNYFQKDWAEYFMMQLIVDDLDACWAHIVPRHAIR